MQSTPSSDASDAAPDTAAHTAPIRLGYVGCGFMAQSVHLPNLLAAPGCEVVALAEERPELGARVQAALGIPRRYRHHTELLADDEIDAVAVSAAFGVQGQIARDALLAGKHVFMEKPMALSLAQADEILAAARATDRRIMVGYMKRYDAGNELAHATVRQWLDDGSQGPLTYLRNHGFGGNWIAGLDAPRITSEELISPAPLFGPAWLPPDFVQPYVNYLQQFTHNLNLLRWFAGAVDAAGDTVSVRAVDLDDDGYSGIVILDLNGVRGVLESGRVSHHAWDEHTQAYFQHGWVKVQSPPLLHRQATAAVEIYRAGSEQTVTHPHPAPPYSWSYRRQIDHFIACLHTGAPFRSGAADTRTDVRLFEEIYRGWLQQRGIL